MLITSLATITANTGNSIVKNNTIISIVFKSSHTAVSHNVSGIKEVYAKQKFG